MLDKANRVADKYMVFERSVHIGTARERTRKAVPARISHSSQFQSALENYPELKANENIMELLNQIKECENGLAAQKMNYNTMVENYNTLIHTFPVVLLRKICRFQDTEFYRKDPADDMISDESLGI